MAKAPPLLIFETNLILDLLLERDAMVAFLMDLAEAQKIELKIPEFALMEFRGAALRTIAATREKVNQTRALANELARSAPLARGANLIQEGCKVADAELHKAEERIEPVLDRFKRTAMIVPHTPDIHLKGDLRFAAGYPPGRAQKGIQDCRIYEAVLEIVRADRNISRNLKAFVTKDKDFHHPELISELANLGIILRDDVGRLYGELR